MNYIKTLAATAAALLAIGTSAKAGCVDPRQASPALIHGIPGYIVAGLQPKGAAAQLSPAASSAGNYIIGTWLVTYVTGGNPGGQAFIQWHGDHTEWEDINFPIESGNVCLGSWKIVDQSHVERLHLGWLYNAGQLSGYLRETETVTISGPNAYTGVTDIKLFDTAGNVLVELPGTSSAVRIAP